MTQDQIDTIALGTLNMHDLEKLMSDHFVEIWGLRAEGHQFRACVTKGPTAAPLVNARVFNGEAVSMAGALANAIAQACRAEGIDVR